MLSTLKKRRLSGCLILSNARLDGKSRKPHRYVARPQFPLDDIPYCVATFISIQEPHEMTTRKILSEVSGVVAQIDIKPGVPLKEGQGIMTIESMKMDMSVVPGFCGKLVELLIDQGDVVSEGQVIAMAQV